MRNKDKSLNVEQPQPIESNSKDKQRLAKTGEDSENVWLDARATHLDRIFK